MRGGAAYHISLHKIRIFMQRHLKTIQYLRVLCIAEVQKFSSSRRRIIGHNSTNILHDPCLSLLSTHTPILHCRPNYLPPTECPQNEYMLLCLFLCSCLIASIPSVWLRMRVRLLAREQSMCLIVYCLVRLKGTEEKIQFEILLSDRIGVLFVNLGFK